MPQSLKNEYGNVSPASLGAIQRNLLALADQGGDKFFGEPAHSIPWILFRRMLKAEAILMYSSCR